MNNRLRVLRAEKNWTQAQLAEIVGVSRQAVIAVENGKYDPALPLAFKLARVWEDGGRSVCVGRWFASRKIRNSYKEEYHMSRIFVAAVLAIIAVTAIFGNDERAEKNKAIVRRVFTDMLREGKYEAASEILAKDFVNHGTTKDLGFDQNLANVRGWRAAFPDLEMTVEREIAEGDFVTVLWRGRGTNTGSGNGLNATGKKAEGRGIGIFRVVDGRIKEEWTEYSQLLLLSQLGLVPGRQ